MAARSVARELEAMQPWSQVAAGDVGGLDRIQESVQAIVARDLDDVLAGVHLYLKRGDDYDVGSMSKLYVLNRYLFDVPPRVSADERRFGSFRGVPVDADGIGELWPWELDEAGRPQLTGFYRGYAGESYLAREEADAFRRRYGPRARAR